MHGKKVKEKGEEGGGSERGLRETVEEGVEIIRGGRWKIERGGRWKTEREGECGGGEEVREERRK